MFDADAQDFDEARDKLIRILLIVSGGFAAVVAVSYVLTISWHHPIPRDATTLVVGRDFLSFWMYGRAATSPNAGLYYDLAIYNRELAPIVGPNYPPLNWAYAPSFFLLTAPFGQLPYFPALILWWILSVGVFAWIASRHISDARLLLALLFSPAVILGVISGQNSLLSAALLIAIFACLDRRPIFAGILIGVLAVKPQLGLLFPFMLAASGRWRVFLAATATVLAILALTTALFGMQVWLDYVQKGLPTQAIVLMDSHRIATPFFPTIYMNLRGIDMHYQNALAVQGVVTILAIVATVWVFRFRRNGDPQLQMSFFFACSISASAYLLSYDTLPLAYAALLLLGAGKLDAAGTWHAKLAFWLPAIQLAFGLWHIPGPALIAPAFAVYLLLRLLRVGERDLGSRQDSPEFGRAKAG